MRRSPYPTALAFDRGAGRTPLLARGALSAQLLWVLTEEPQAVPQLRQQAEQIVATSADVLADDDFQLALVVLLRAALPRLAGVDDALGVAAVAARAGAPCSRTPLERGPAGRWSRRRQPAGDAGPADVPARAGRARRRATTARRSRRTCTRRRTLEQFREFLVHRSVYHLQRGRPAHLGDPAAARAGQGRAGGDPGRRVRRRAGRSGCTSRCSPRHARARASTTPTARYLDASPGDTLAGPTSCRCSGCTAGWRGALLGHLAALEMTSSLPNRRYGNGPAPARLRRRRDRVLRRARRGRRGARADRRRTTCAGPSSRRAGAGRRRPVRRRLLPRRWTRGSPRTLLDRWAAGALAALRERGRRRVAARAPDVERTGDRVDYVLPLRVAPTTPSWPS